MTLFGGPLLALVGSNISGLFVFAGVLSMVAAALSFGVLARCARPLPCHSVGLCVAECARLPCRSAPTPVVAQGSAASGAADAPMIEMWGETDFGLNVNDASQVWQRWSENPDTGKRMAPMAAESPISHPSHARDARCDQPAEPGADVGAAAAIEVSNDGQRRWSAICDRFAYIASRLHDAPFICHVVLFGPGPAFSRNRNAPS